MSLDGTQSRSGRYREEKYLLTTAGIEPRILGCLSRNLVTTLNELSRLPISWSWFQQLHPIVTFFLLLLPAKRTVIISNGHRQMQSCITKSYSCYVTQNTMHSKCNFTAVIRVVVHAARMHQLYSRKWHFKGRNKLELRTAL